MSHLIHKLRVVSIFVFSLFSATCFAQSSYFNIGFNVGNLGNGANSLKNEITLYNRVKYEGSDNPIEMPSFVRGLNFDFQLGGEDAKSFYVFWNWSNRHVIAKGSGIDPLNLQNVDFSFKYRHNNLNLAAFGFKFTDNFGIAYSPVDIGKLKVFLKTNDGSYDEFYNVDKGLLSSYTMYGSSYYLDFFIKNKINIRLGYYKSWGGVDLRDQEDVLTVHHYNANRFTLAINYKIGLND